MVQKYSEVLLYKNGVHDVGSRAITVHMSTISMPVLEFPAGDGFVSRDVWFQGLGCPGAARQKPFAHGEDSLRGSGVSVSASLELPHFQVFLRSLNAHVAPSTSLGESPHYPHLPLPFFTFISPLPRCQFAPAGLGVDYRGCLCFWCLILLQPRTLLGFPPVIELPTPIQNSGCWVRLRFGFLELGFSMEILPQSFWVVLVLTFSKL